MAQLSTPQLSLTDSVLTVSNIDDNATSLKLIRNGFDYKNLFVINDTYTNCTASSHVGLIASDDEAVTITLSADGTSYKLPITAPTVTGAIGTYTRTSDTVGTLVLNQFFKNVSFSVIAEEMSSGETWIINPVLTYTTSFESSINFRANTIFFNTFIWGFKEKSEETYLYYVNSESANKVMIIYLNGSWIADEAYRTVTFETAPTGDLLTWLQANAVKQ